MKSNKQLFMTIITIMPTPQAYKQLILFNKTNYTTPPTTVPTNTKSHNHHNHRSPYPIPLPVKKNVCVYCGALRTIFFFLKLLFSTQNQTTYYPFHISLPINIPYFNNGNIFTTQHNKISTHNSTQQ